MIGEMGFQDDPDVDVPDGTISVWRYVPLNRFQEVLASSTLYFCRLDVFQDKFEGALTNRMSALHEHVLDAMALRDLHGLQLGGLEDTKNLFESRPRYRRFMYVNCWHKSDYESVAMWQLYLKGQAGVAIQTTCNELFESLRPPKDGRLLIGAVRYVDFREGLFKALGPLEPYFRKSIEYQHESEVRLLYQFFPQEFFSEKARSVLEIAAEIGGTVRIPPEEFNFNIEMPSGVSIPIDLTKGIRRIVVSPAAPQSFVDTVEELISTHFLSIPVARSRLDDVPRFK